MLTSQDLLQIFLFSLFHSLLNRIWVALKNKLSLKVFFRFRPFFLNKRVFPRSPLYFHHLAISHDLNLRLISLAHRLTARIRLGLKPFNISSLQLERRINIHIVGRLGSLLIRFLFLHLSSHLLIVHVGVIGRLGNQWVFYYRLR